jgi:hypothetical protein
MLGPFSPPTFCTRNPPLLSRDGLSGDKNNLMYLLGLVNDAAAFGLESDLGIFLFDIPILSLFS